MTSGAIQYLQMERKKNRNENFQNGCVLLNYGVPTKLFAGQRNEAEPKSPKKIEREDP